MIFSKLKYFINKRKFLMRYLRDKEEFERWYNETQDDRFVYEAYLYWAENVKKRSR